MKIAVAGRGGVGKTTVSGTLSRALARAGHTVLAVHADLNPMLGVSTSGHSWSRVGRSCAV